jgi:hypothetical protein
VGHSAFRLLVNQKSVGPLATTVAITEAVRAAQNIAFDLHDVCIWTRCPRLAHRRHGLTSARCLLSGESGRRQCKTIGAPMSPEESSARAQQSQRYLYRSLCSNQQTSPGQRVTTDAEIDAWIRRSATTVHHPASTCAMGAGADKVLDPQLRVNGVDGLRVVDASAMPDLVSGHINACVLMMAEKASDIILGKPVLAAHQQN